jgi:hypothetical protein
MKQIYFLRLQRGDNLNGSGASGERKQGLEREPGGGGWQRRYCMCQKEGEGGGLSCLDKDALTTHTLGTWNISGDKEVGDGLLAMAGWQ